jgi:hypothetical protein
VAAGFILAGAGPFKDRLKLAAIWAGGTTLVVAAVYALMARVAGVEPAGFLHWTLGYLHDEHGIQLHWLRSPVKSAIGVAGTVLETGWVQGMFNQQQNGEAVWLLYGGLLVAGCAVAAVLASRRSVRERVKCLWHSNTPVVMLALAWSAFVFLWEPAGKYWSVELFPLALLASLWLRESRKRTALLVAGVLVAVSGWNLYANHRQDVAYSVNYPPPLLEQIRGQLGPEDVFIVAGRDWYADIDYDLLLNCLDDWPRNPAMALLDECVKPGLREPWQQTLDVDIREALAAGGRVFVAGHVFWSDSYRDIDRSADPFSEYARPEFAGVDGERLRSEIKNFFDHYKLTESGFKIATNEFWELKSADATHR